MPYSRYSLILFLAMSAAQPALAGGRVHFLSHGPSAAAFGRGETGGAVFDGIASVFYNPALGARLAGGSVQLAHFTLAEGTQYNFAGAGYSGSPYVFYGLSVINLHSGDTELRRYIDDEPQTVQTSQTACLLTAARSFGRGRAWCAGISVKYIALDLYRATGSAWGADAGLSYTASGPRLGAGKSTVNAGVALQNAIAPEMTLVSSTDRWDAACRASLALKVPVAWHMQTCDTVSLLADAVSEGRTTRLYWGGEYEFLKDYRLRAGSYDDHLTIGAGLRWDGFCFDYAVDLGALAVFNRFSLSWFWGGNGRKPKTPGGSAPENTSLHREARQALSEDKRERERIDREVRPAFKAAVKQFNDGNYIDATDILSGILLEHPEYEGAAYYLSRIKERMAGDSGEDTLDFERSAYARGYQAYYAQRFPDALREWERVLQLDPHCDELKKYAGQTMSYLKDQEKVARERELDRSAADLLERGRQQFEASRWIPCIKTMEALQLQCRREPFRRAVEYHGLAQGYIDRAVRELARSIKTPRSAPDKPKAAEEIDEVGAERRYREGLVLYAQGKPQDAEKSWEIALRLNPYHEKARKALDRIK